MGAVIGSALLFGYEGQARLPGSAGVDHALRYDQQQTASWSQPAGDWFDGVGYGAPIAARS
jgi:hypothetical protein